MLSYSTVEPHTLELLKKIMAEPLFSELRLVGGTALALLLGHRISIDLDFFGTLEADNQDIQEALSKIGELQVLGESKNTKAYMLDNVKLDIVNYKYEWLAPPVVENGLRLAATEDIAAMKLGAIDSRGSRKDFVDIYFLLQKYSIAQLTEFYIQKYPKGSVMRILMGLTYFADAESEPMPDMLSNVQWPEMKSTIISKVNNFK